MAGTYIQQEISVSGGSGYIDGTSNTYADLPAASSNSGRIYIVETDTGVRFINKKKAGLWRSDGSTWTRLSDTTGYLKEGDDISQLTNDSGYVTSGGAVDSVAGKTGVVTLVKGDVGLGSVDNTTDLGKPISTATQTALDGKQATLVSATNIKTINSTSLLGSGDIVISGGGGGGTSIQSWLGRVTYDSTNWKTGQQTAPSNFNSSSGAATSDPVMNATYPPTFVVPAGTTPNTLRLVTLEGLGTITDVDIFVYAIEDVLTDNASTTNESEAAFLARAVKLADSSFTSDSSGDCQSFEVNLEGITSKSFTKSGFLYVYISKTGGGTLYKTTSMILECS